MPSLMVHELYGIESTARLRLGAVGDARQGDTIRFKSGALRVETAPLISGRRVRLQGRDARTGAFVTRWYFDNVACGIDAPEER